MPWCEPCERFYSPNTATRQGQCPQCGYQLGDPQAPARRGAEAATGRGAEAPAGSQAVEAAVDQPATLAADRRSKAPWHFKLLVLAAGGYVGWRLVQLAVRGLQALF